MRNKRRSRLGFGTVEVVVAALIVMMMMALTVQMVASTIAARRSAERRQWALHEAANVMERLASLEWDELSDARTETIQLSKACQSVLPSPRLRIKIGEETAPVLKRIRVEIRWSNGARGEEAPVRLTTWVAKRDRRPA